MRNVLFLVGMSMVIAVAWAQENKSVDPAWLFVPESVEGVDLSFIMYRRVHSSLFCGACGQGGLPCPLTIPNP